MVRRLRRAAPSGRKTALHWAAEYGCTKSAVALLVGGADQTIKNNDDGYAVLPKQQRDGRTPIGPNRRRRTPRQTAQENDFLGEYDAAVAEVRPPHSRARSSWLRAVYARMSHMRGCSTACRGRVLRRTPTHPRDDLRVAPLLSDGGSSCGNIPHCRAQLGSAAHAAVTST
jgi:hypothetical protein